MKKFFSFPVILLVVVLLVANMSHTNAQCAVVGKDANGTQVSVSISCDFVVYIDTNNPVVDNVNYSNDKQAWVAAHPDDYNAWINIDDPHIEIHQADFNAMSAAKQAAILDRPDLYVVIP